MTPHIIAGILVFVLVIILATLVVLLAGRIIHQPPTVSGGDEQLRYVYVADPDFHAYEDAFIASARRRGMERADPDGVSDPIALMYAQGTKSLKNMRSAPLDRIRAKIRASLQAGPLTNKVELHKALGPNSEIVPRTLQYPAGNRDGPPFPGGVWIWRPEKMWGGWGVDIITSQDQLDATRQTLAKKYPRKRGILTRYITNPKLYPLDGKKYKFHIRVWLLVVAEKGGARLGLYTNGKLITSNQPYRAADYTDKRIHDTHITTAATSGLRFPEDYPGDAQELLRKLTKMFARVGNRLLSRVKPARGARSGFELLGADVIVDAADRPWLLEINMNPSPPIRGPPGGPDSQKSTVDMINDGLWSYALDPLLGTGPQKTSPNFVEVYSSGVEVPLGRTTPSITLVDIRARHRAGLQAITSQPETMKSVGDGEPWGDTQLDNFIRYNITEQKEGGSRRNFYWAIEGCQSFPKLFGVVGIHAVDYGKGSGPDSTKGLVFVTRFLDKKVTGRGVGTEALRRAIDLYRKAKKGARPSVYADVRPSNIASLKSLKRVGFQEVGQVSIRGRPYIRLRATGQDVQTKALESILDKFETTAATGYSTVRGRPAFLRQEVAYFGEVRQRINPHTIIDGTAHVGVDTAILAQIFPTAQLTAVERDPETYRRLAKNMSAAGLDNRVHTVNQSVVDYFNSRDPRAPHADLVYLDPPWGGPGYSTADDLPLPGDKGDPPTPLHILVNRVLASGTPLVVLKVPHNFQHARFANRLEGGRIVRVTPVEYQQRRARAAFLLLEIGPDSIT